MLPNDRSQTGQMPNHQRTHRVWTVHDELLRQPYHTNFLSEEVITNVYLQCLPVTASGTSASLCNAQWRLCVSFGPDRTSMTVGQ